MWILQPRTVQVHNFIIIVEWLVLNMVLYSCDFFLKSKMRRSWRKKRKLLLFYWNQKNYWIQISLYIRLGKYFKCPGYKICNLMSSSELFPWGHWTDTNISSLLIIPEGLDIKQLLYNIQYSLKSLESEACMLPRILLQDSLCPFSNGFLDSLLSAHRNQLYKCPTTLFLCY